jgi:hypothetical protein
MPSRTYFSFYKKGSLNPQAVRIRVKQIYVTHLIEFAEFILGNVLQAAAMAGLLAFKVAHRILGNQGLKKIRHFKLQKLISDKVEGLFTLGGTNTRTERYLKTLEC